MIHKYVFPYIVYHLLPYFIVPFCYPLAKPYPMALSNRLLPLMYTPMATPKLMRYGCQTDYLGRLIQSYVGGRILSKFSV